MPSTNRPGVLAVITARGGSQRLPGKNIRRFAGKPLIAHTIEAALEAKAAGAIERLIVSTDSKEIAQVAQDWGAEVPFLRPADLATASAGSMDTLRHAGAWIARNDTRTYRWILLLQPTSPLRTAEDIRTAYDLGDGGDATSVIGVSETAASELDKWMLLEDGHLRPAPWGRDARARVGAPANGYVINGSLYLTRWDVVMEMGDLFGPRALPLVIPPERAIDIDTEADFIMAEALFRHLFERSTASDSPESRQA